MLRTVDHQDDDVRPDKRAVADGFDRAAARYDLMVALNPGYRHHLRVAAEAVVEGVRPSNRPVTLLDLGCGSGLSTRELVQAASRAGLRARVVGVDASAGMLARARRRDWPEGVDFVQGRGEQLEQLGLPPADGALACYLLRNVTDLPATLAGVRRALRPGAGFVAEDYSVRGNAGALRRWRAVNAAIILPLARVVGGDVDLYRYLHSSVEDFASIEELAESFAAAGFTRVETRTFGGWQRDILHVVRGRA